MSSDKVGGLGEAAENVVVDGGCVSVIWVG